jgi:hypothetical protein
LTIVGAHTPEFAFEHVLSNVTQAARQLGVTYPIAIDNQDATLNACQNSYWPAEYLIDATGRLRHVDFGEGRYSEIESFIRHLLVAANPKVVLPEASGIADTTPTEATTPASYLISVDGAPTTTVRVDGDPTHYQLVGSPSTQQAVVSLAVIPGMQAYDSTFG